MMDGAGLFFTYKYKDTIKFFRHLSGYISFYCVSCIPRIFWYLGVYHCDRTSRISIEDPLSDYS